MKPIVDKAFNFVLNQLAMAFVFAFFAASAFEDVFVSEPARRKDPAK